MPVANLKSKWVSGHLVFHGEGRMDFTNVSSETDGAVVRAGSTSARLESSAASQSMYREVYEMNHDGGYGHYIRTYVSTAAISGDAFRSYATVEDVAAATVRGAHISLSFGTSGTVTGLACAVEATLHMPSGGGMAGTNYAIKAAINSDGANADPAGATTIGFLGVVAQGTQAGIDDFEDDGVFLDFQGFTADADASHFLSSVSLAELPGSSVGVRCKVGSTLYYLPLVAASAWN
jgi:hypothetical protein